MPYASVQEAAEQYSDQRWRLNNLYWIRDKQGKRVRFQLNPLQERFYEDLHYRNVLLKSRQWGGTTIVDLYYNDTCIFNPDQAAGIIAHTVPDASNIFQEKVKFPLDNLPEGIKALVAPVQDAAQQIRYKNGSSIRVSTSFRSGTLQMLHVSEMGKIAAKDPQKAREIVTGAIEAVPEDGVVVIESTAEGVSGAYYDMVQQAKALRDQHKHLSRLDYKLHFVAWHESPEYTLKTRDVLITPELVQYFQDLEGRGITLSKEQKDWYAKKREALGEDIRREYPSYEEEAFHASVIGAYYKEQMDYLRRNGRIGNVPCDPHGQVHTFWDIGLNDSMAIWCYQQIGPERRLLRYHEDSGEGWEHYAKLLKEWGYNYGIHYMPHDVRVRQLGRTAKTNKQLAEEVGIRPIEIAVKPRNEAETFQQIQATRGFLQQCWIDERLCAKGIEALDNYRKEWDEKAGLFKNRPLHDWASHCADALRTGAVSYRAPAAARARPVKRVASGGWT